MSCLLSTAVRIYNKILIYIKSIYFLFVLALLHTLLIMFLHLCKKGKGKVFPLQARCSPEGG